MLVWIEKIIINNILQKESILTLLIQHRNQINFRNIV
jgi:hypothetical protein